ncbi:Protein HASTY 1, partial [Mucuna pruriens]
MYSLKMDRACTYMPTHSARHARLQTCTSFIQIAKAVDKSTLPHMKGIAGTMVCLQREGRSLQGEHNLLGEAFLVMASFVGIQQQPKKKTKPLSPTVDIIGVAGLIFGPHGLVQLCSAAPVMWSIFHKWHPLRGHLKRRGSKKANWNS